MTCKKDSSIFGWVLSFISIAVRCSFAMARRRTGNTASRTTSINGVFLLALKTGRRKPSTALNEQRYQKAPGAAGRTRRRNATFLSAAAIKQRLDLKVGCSFSHKSFILNALREPFFGSSSPCGTKKR